MKRGKGISGRQPGRATAEKVDARPEVLAAFIPLSIPTMELTISMLDMIELALAAYQTVARDHLTLTRAQVARAWVVCEKARRMQSTAALVFKPKCHACGADCEGQRGAGYLCECENSCTSMH